MSIEMDFPGTGTSLEPPESWHGNVEVLEKLHRVYPSALWGHEDFFSNPWHLRQQRYEDHDAS
jgi:hypothetical protein